MEIRRVILSLSAIAAIAPAIARADDDLQYQPNAAPCSHETPSSYTPPSEYTPPGNPTGNVQDADWRWGDRDRDHDGDRDDRWDHHRRGRWELQTFNRWIEGRYDQVWVPERCDHVMRPGRWGRPWGGHAVVCQPGHYESRWSPGRYEQVQQWVWVPWR